MLRPKIVPRPTEGGRRATGDIPDSLRRVLHRETLTRDLGIEPRAVAPRSHRRKGIDGGTMILVVFVAIIAFAAILAVLLWRDGRVDALFPAHNHPVAGPRTDWILSGHAPRIAEPSAETANVQLHLVPADGHAADDDTADDSGVATDEE